MGALIDQGPDVARLIAEQHIIRPIAANWLWLVHNSRGQGNDYPIRRCIHNGNRLHQILFTWMPCWMPCWMPAQLRDLLSLSVQCKRSGRVVQCTSLQCPRSRGSKSGLASERKRVV